MDGSFGEQGSGTSRASKIFFAAPQILASLVSWLAGLIRLTEEEQKDAGIYLDRLGGE
jgi:hypothetical protein